MTNNLILNIIDKHLQLSIDEGLNILPINIEKEMRGVNEIDNKDEWQKWFSIESTITDTEIEEIETKLCYKLPKSYTAFLKHKHFYDLYISEARFSGYEIRNWKRNFISFVFDNYPREFLYDKGFIPFAEWNDWGLLCFNTNKVTEAYDYSIVIWDHEKVDEFSEFSENFENLILKLDKQFEK